MRAFLAACLAAIILAVGGYFGASALQRPSGAVYTTDGARTDPAWNWRQAFKRADGKGVRLSAASVGTPDAQGMSESCDIETTYRWIVIDFSGSDSPGCTE
jgi:hypothetical protein